MRLSAVARFRWGRSASVTSALHTCAAECMELGTAASARYTKRDVINRLFRHSFPSLSYPPLIAALIGKTAFISIKLFDQYALLDVCVRRLPIPNSLSTPAHGMEVTTQSRKNYELLFSLFVSFFVEFPLKSILRTLPVVRRLLPLLTPNISISN